ncbi:MAG: cobyrinate a,c-diamide synthase [Actinomycetota bacterium]
MNDTPRIVVAGTQSGVGKTTVATGLMAALKETGMNVASAKVGPDFIDPGFHQVATGRPGRNLDPWMCGASMIAPLAARASAGSDLLIVEGMMGLFDDSGETPGVGSTAEVARLIEAPVILVVDASALSSSVAAIVHGFAHFDSSIKLAGVVLNRVGSAGHETLLREALAPSGIPVVGVLREDQSLVWRERHLGLVPVVERPHEVSRSIGGLAGAIKSGFDLERVAEIARTAPALHSNELQAPKRQGSARFAIAHGPAFSFMYPENLESLEQAGAELEFFDPMRDAQLPEEIDGLYIGGGFPEVFASELAENELLMKDVRERIDRGLVWFAECGGLIWLSESLDGSTMANVIPTNVLMTDSLTIGYRSATARFPTPLGPSGATWKGHEFHRSICSPAGDALELTGRFGHGRAGFASNSFLASYLHLHFSSDPSIAEHFVATACSKKKV